MKLAAELPTSGAEEALRDAFHGRPLRHTESTWRAHLARMARY